MKYIHDCLSVHVSIIFLSGINHFSFLYYVKKFLSDQKTLKSQIKKDPNLQIQFRYYEKAKKFEKKISHFF